MSSLRHSCLPILLIASLVLSLPLTAQLLAPPITPEAALTRVLQQTPAQADWFDSTFLAQVPTAQIDQIVMQYVAQLGTFHHAEATAEGYTAHLERGTFPAKIVLSPSGRIVGLWFGLPELAQARGFDDMLKDFAKLPGKVSVAVIADGKPLAGLQADLPLGVGSAFKLAVLAALNEQIAAGKHRLDEVVALRPAWKSLPSGTLQQWPDGTPLTLATLTNQMISINDNTAADAVLSIAGRENVEKLAPRNRPFLSTREAFVLKASPNAALLARYRSADEAGRRTILDELARLPLPEGSQLKGAPSLDIEWFFTANELCTLIGRVADAPAMRINPGLAKSADWRQVAFKGGSEEGVLNLATALTGKDGKHYCVAATWNDTAALEQARFFTLYGGLLSALAKTSAK